MKRRAAVYLASLLLVMGIPMTMDVAQADPLGRIDGVSPIGCSAWQCDAESGSTLYFDGYIFPDWAAHEWALYAYEVAPEGCSEGNCPLLARAPVYTGQQGFEFSTPVSFTAPGQLFVVILVADGPLPPPPTYMEFNHTGAVEHDYVYISLIWPPTEPIVSAKPKVFFPLVRDGYRDGTAISVVALSRTYEFCVDAASIVIHAADGSTVWERESQVPSGECNAGRGDTNFGPFYWSGRRESNGTLVPEGKYRVTGYVYHEGSIVGESSDVVTVNSTTVTTTRRLIKLGTQTSSRDTRGNCYARGSRRVLTLDCWGGSYAVARYRFPIPNHAVHVRRSINTNRSHLDVCCDGTIRRSWSRGKATVRVTGWRAVDVVEARVVYDLRKTI